MAISKTEEIDWVEYEQAHPITVHSHLTDPHPVTRSTMTACGLPIEPSSETSPAVRWDGFCICVSEFNRDRALRLVDALLKACDERGFELRRDDDNGNHGGVSIYVEAEPIALALREHGSSVTHLAFEIGSRPRNKWKDTVRRPLEKRLNEIMLSLRNIALGRIAARDALVEEERRMQAMLGAREALRAEVEAEQRELDMLHKEAADWEKARNIRAYIKAIEALPVATEHRKSRKSWAKWAHDQADRLDPLAFSPPSILDTPRRLYRKLSDYEVLNEDGSIEQIWG